MRTTTHRPRFSAYSTLTVIFTLMLVSLAYAQEIIKDTPLINTAPETTEDIPPPNISLGLEESNPDTPPPVTPTVVPNTYIVIAESENLPDELTLQMASLDAQFTSILDEIGVAVVTSSNPDIVAELSKIPGIKSVVPDLDVQWLDPAVDTLFVNPPARDDDSFFSIQWGLDAVNAIEAWNAGFRGNGATVAVLDTGFDLDHPDLQPNILMAKSASFVPGENLQFTGTGLSHGSHVAGIIAAADNAVGVIGVAPQAKLVLVKVLSDRTGSGQFSWIVSGIMHAANQDVDVINMSLGGYLPASEPYIQTINRATTYAYGKGVTLMAAAGNEARNRNADPNTVMMPGDASFVLGISATAPYGWAVSPTNHNFDNFASYSNYGNPAVDFAAPGGDRRFPRTDTVVIGGWQGPANAFDQVISCTLDGWAWAVGTSMATPHAAGVAALVVGRYGSSVSPAFVENKLAASAADIAPPGRDPFFGRGRLDAYRAVTI